MAIPVQNFQAGSFLDNNPGLAGAGAMQNLILQALRNRQARLSNKSLDIKNQFLPQQLMDQNQAQEANTALMQTRNQYLPQLSDARLKMLQEQIPMLQARAKMMQEQANNAPLIAQLKLQQAQQSANNPLSSLGKAIADYSRLEKENSPLAPILKNYIQQESAGKQGLQVQMNPDGTLSAISMGGSAPVGPATTSTGSEQPASNILKNQMTASRYSGKGGSYTITDPDGTKRVVSSPTNQTTSRLQQQVSAVENVKPILKNITDNLPQFQRGETRLKEKGEAFGNEWLYQNNALPAKWAKAQSALEVAPEALLKAYQLNTTDYAMQTMRRGAQPVKGETPKQYSDRILELLEELKERQIRNEGYLRGGIPIGPGESMPAAQSTTNATPQYSQEDLEYTAKQNNMTVAQVKKILEAQNAR